MNAKLNNRALMDTTKDNILCYIECPLNCCVQNMRIILPDKESKSGWGEVVTINPTNWSNQSLLRLVVIFAGVFFSLQWGYQQAAGTVIEKAIIDMATVRPSAFMINQISPGEQVIAEGHRLVSPFAKLSVLNGCEGTESLFLIIAAILAFRATWRHKLAGLTLGVVVIYLANQARIVSLYFALRSDPALFSALHGYIAPTLIIAVGCVFYLWWMLWPQQNISAQNTSPHA